MASPTHWKYTTYTVPQTNSNFNWATATVKKEGWIYIFGIFKTSTVLSRIRLHDAESAHWEKKEYWSNQNSWVKNISSLNELKAIPGLPGTSEMSFGYNKNFGWYTVQIPAFSFDIHFYTAKNLTGPWIDQDKIYTISSPWNSNSFITYAAKVHPELAASENEIVLTYNINQMDLPAVIHNIKQPHYWGLYIPQFVVVNVRKNI